MSTQAAINKLKKLDLTSINKKKVAYEQSFLNIPTTDPWVPITLGDKTYKLEYSYYAAQVILRETGKNIFAGELTVDDLSNMETLVSVLVIGLQTHQSDLPVEDVEKRLTLKHRMYYAHCISKAMEVTQPDLSQMEAVLGEIKDLTEELQSLEAGDTTAPLPEIVPSPIFGEPAE
jgi:hypothetical protein